MDLTYAKLKNFMNQKSSGKKQEESFDIEKEESKDDVMSHIRFLLSLLNDERERDSSQLHTLKCLSLFVHYDIVKKTLHKHYKKTKYDRVKNAIREIYEGKFDNKDLLKELEELEELEKLEEQARAEFGLSKN